MVGEIKGMQRVGPDENNAVVNMMDGWKSELPKGPFTETILESRPDLL
jgi:hypothetical protein